MKKSCGELDDSSFEGISSTVEEDEKILRIEFILA